MLEVTTNNAVNFLDRLDAARTDAAIVNKMYLQQAGYATESHVQRQLGFVDGLLAAYNVLFGEQVPDQLVIERQMEEICDLYDPGYLAPSELNEFVRNQMMDDYDYSIDETYQAEEATIQQASNVPVTLDGTIQYINSLAEAIVDERRKLSESIAIAGDIAPEETFYPMAFYFTVSQLTAEIDATIKMAAALFFADDRQKGESIIKSCIDYKQERKDVSYWLCTVDDDLHAPTFETLQCYNVDESGIPNWCYSMSL